MLKIGITGGIGSGKTTVCGTWQALGAYIIDADDLAKNIMVNDTGVKRKLKQVFGKKTYNPDGSLNRSFLAEQAFEKNRVQQLNAIIHPKIPAAVDAIIQKIEKQKYPMVVYEAALLLENLNSYRLDYIVLVLADKLKRMQRVGRRDKTSQEKITGRMNKQDDFELVTEKADFIIRNDGSLSDLELKAERLYRKILENA